MDRARHNSLMLMAKATFKTLERQSYCCSAPPHAPYPTRSPSTVHTFLIVCLLTVCFVGVFLAQRAEANLRLSELFLDEFVDAVREVRPVALLGARDHLHAACASAPALVRSGLLRTAWDGVWLFLKEPYGPICLQHNSLQPLRRTDGLLTCFPRGCHRLGRLLLPARVADRAQKR
mmetsp:Transcript_547/g.894  ORF Transcript_547/g.894 Transcript_547/m.894 type:complete len:176 (-) Transcript_547:195-722(-)